MKQVVTIPSPICLGVWFLRNWFHEDFKICITCSLYKRLQATWHIQEV